MPNAKTFLPRLALATSLGAFALFALPTAESAAQVSDIAFLTESKIWLEGDSTLHRYKSAAKTWKLTAGVTPKGDLSNLAVVVPVRELKSGDAGLDKNLYAAIKAEQFPTIRFAATTATLDLKGATASARAAGSLTIAGAKKPFTVKASGTLTGDTLRLRGSQTLLMSDFGIQPPVLMLGAIKCTDAITVHYEIVAKVKP